MQEVAKVCLVVGNAHGGSTITNLILGQHPDVFSAGSLRGFPDNGQLVAGNVCACGEPAVRCGFWSQVKDRLDQVQQIIDREHELYRLILEHSSRKIVVDVDHGLTRLRELLGNSRIDLHVVYVHRSLAGLIHSQVRKARERGELRRPIVDFVKLCIRVGRGWAFKKFVVPNFCESQSLPFYLVNYEKLCSAPDLELYRIGEVLGVDYSEVGARISQDRLLAMPEHLIRGNRKLRQNKEIQLRIDDSWKSSRQYVARFLAIMGATLGAISARLSMAKTLRQMTKEA